MSASAGPPAGAAGDGSPVEDAQLLRVSGLTVRYGRGRRRSPVTAVADASLTIGRGETVAVVGESGSGKSTLGNAILGLVPAVEGSVVFRGEDITHATARRRRQLTRDIQAIFQDPYASLNPSRSIQQTLVEPLRAHPAAEPRDERAVIGDALEMVGLSRDDGGRYPAHFSGGQLQRIAIARALILRPSLVVCDEPTSALDLSIQAQVLNLMQQLQRELATSYLFISHDLAVVRHVAHRVVVLYHGRVVETGPTEAVCTAPRDPYTRALLEAAPLPDPVEQRRRHPAGAAPADDATAPGGAGD